MTLNDLIDALAAEIETVQPDLERDLQQLASLEAEDPAFMDALDQYASQAQRMGEAAELAGGSGDSDGHGSPSDLDRYPSLGRTHVATNAGSASACTSSRAISPPSFASTPARVGSCTISMPLPKTLPPSFA